MPLPEHIANRFAELRAKLDDSRTALAELETQTELAWPAPPPPPPPSKPSISEVLIESRPGALRVTWQVFLPPGAALASQVIGWGKPNQFVGSATLHPGAREHLISGLDPVEHEVDVLLIVGAEVVDRRRTKATPMRIVGSPPPPPGGRIPTRADRDAIVAAAGARGQLTEIRSSVWTPPSPTVSNVKLEGVLYWSRPERLVLRNVQCWQVMLASGAGTLDAEGCTITGHPSLTLGAGGIHFFGQTGWRIDRCDISGTGDGTQCIGPGRMTRSWIHDLVVGMGPSGPTHNDGMQCYGGEVHVDQCVIEMPEDRFGQPRDQVNGCLFAEGGVIVATESWLTSPFQALNTKAGAIRLVRCHVEGNIVGNVTVV